MNPLEGERLEAEIPGRVVVPYVREVHATAAGISYHIVLATDMDAYKAEPVALLKYFEAIDELEELRHLASPGVEIGHRGGVIATHQNSPTCPGVGKVGN